MKNDNVLKTPQLLTKLRVESGTTNRVKDDDEDRKSFRVHHFSHKDEFGWGFPEVEGIEKKNVIDMKWIDEYNDEIDKLQVVIKKERSLSFSSQGQNLLAESQSLKSEESELEKFCNSTHSFDFEIPIQVLDDSPQTLKEADKTDILILHGNDEEIRSSTPITDSCCSICSCPSRDSGISASDDILDILPENRTNNSLLEELEGMSENEQLKSHMCCSLLEELEGTSENEQPDSHTDCSLLEELERMSENEQPESHRDKFTLNNLDVTKHLKETLHESKKITEVLPEDPRQKCPVWYKRFSIGQNDFLNFNSLNWGLETHVNVKVPTKNAYRREDQFNSLSSASDKESSSDDFINEADSEDNRRRQRLRGLWTACDRLEALSLRGGSSFRGLPEVLELVESLSKIDRRLAILKCDLHSLSLQATENRHELSNLQKRASNLLTSTETSRHHMAQLFCLEKLKERLHEEWWSIHYANMVKSEGNYIV